MKNQSPHHVFAGVARVMSESPKHERKIVTKYDQPPAPFRDCDWSAAREDYDLGDCIGHGLTEAAAIADLLMEEGLNQ